MIDNIIPDFLVQYHPPEQSFISLSTERPSPDMLGLGFIQKDVGSYWKTENRGGSYQVCIWGRSLC